MSENNQRLTIFEFRKRYFAPECRPARKTVEQWITKGTREKVRLRANRFDGDYYITIADAEAFMRATTVVPLDERATIKRRVSPTFEKSVEYLRAHGFDV